MNCHEAISNGMILRCVLTLTCFLFIFFKNPKYLWLILPIALTLLDLSDGVFNKYKTDFLKEKNCLKTFEYQVVDKVVDSISYLLFLFLKVDYTTLFFICYRILGVLLFYTTRSSVWLIVFFDFVKEHMLYMHLFGNNYAYLLIFVVLKIAFEYYLHTFININHYKST
jgi:hypothetical protein